MDLTTAVDRLEAIVDRVEREPMPVPVREVWAFGDVTLGLDPIERLDVYVTKDVLMDGDPDAAAAFEKEYGVKGVGTTVRAAWAEANPDRVRASDNGYAAPEACLAAELVDGVDASGDEPIHLEVCNASFDDNVTQRFKGALAREAYEDALDPRGVCLWVDGQRDDEAVTKLREAAFPMPTLADAFGMLGADEQEAETAAAAVSAERAAQEGPSVRGDIV
ncbi:MAG: hypothetical protein PPP55_00280 [Halorubrum sp.]